MDMRGIMQSEPMIKPYIRVAILIAEGKLDSAAVRDDAFMAALAALPEDEWTDDHPVLNPWKRKG